MKKLVLCFAFYVPLAIVSPAYAQENLALLGRASQTSQLNAFEANLAIDGDLANFTHTASGNNGLGPAVWELDLDGLAEIERIVLHNRTSCCGSRLRDVIVSIHEDPYLDQGLIVGPPIEEIDFGEWVWPDAVFQTELLNFENELGVFPNGPALLEVILDEPVTGLYVRVTRIPDPDLSGTGGQGNVDEADVLSLGEVEVFGTGGFQCPNPADPEFGDTRCEEIIVDPPVGGALGDPGIYTVSSFADDDTGDAITYTFIAESDTGTQLMSGPSTVSSAMFNLFSGTWTFTVVVDDDDRCDDTSPDATCVSDPLTIVQGDNLALGKPTIQSSQLGTFTPSLAVDGDLNNFTHTAAGQSPAVWEVDLLDVFEIAAIDIYNRTSCCGSRLRDIIVSIHDVSFAVDPENEPLWESDLLNPENVLGIYPNGPPLLVVEPIPPVMGQYVRITRLSDPDLSGSGGQGNADEADVLSLGEVEVFAVPSNCPAAGDTHCEDLLVTPSGLQSDGDPGPYTLLAAASDDSGDAVKYIFRAVEEGGEVIEIGPTSESFVDVVLAEGVWTLSVQVDDDRCTDVAEDAVCTVEKSIGCADDGDTHCEELIVAGPPGNACGIFELIAFADDDSGDPISYTFVADNGVAPPITRGPQPSNVAAFDLTPGNWSLSVRVSDDGGLCDTSVGDSTCAQEITVGDCAVNIAAGGIAAHSSQLGGFGPELALDGVFNNFTHTLAGNNDLGPAVWEVDLFEDRDIAQIVLHNRLDCCGSRLRDIIVSIHDVSFQLDDPPLGETAEELPIWESALWESELLNPENELGIFPGGPPRLRVDVLGEAGGPVRGRYVRITRLPDPDLSGSAGQGNEDESTVLSLAEVEVFDCEGETCGLPQGDPRFVRGDTDATGTINLTDGIVILQYLFVGAEAPSCLDAADADDSGDVNLTDGIYVLNFLFSAIGSPPPPPYPSCGVDTTPGGPGCEASHPQCE